MILLSIDDDFILNRLVKKVLSDNTITCIVVSNRFLARIIGKTLSGKNTESLNTRIYVFKHNYPEENALKLLIHNSPDKVIDCDPYDKLVFLKKLVQVSHIDKVECEEFLGY